MKMYKNNRFANFMSVYVLLVIIINNILGYNSQLIYKHDWENSITTYIVSHITIHKISWDRKKIIKFEIKIKTRLNFSKLQILTYL